MAIPVFRTDIVKRVANTEPHVFEANSFISFEQAEDEIRFRPDVGIWDTFDESAQVRALVQAYKDLLTLTWSNEYGRSQSKDYEFRLRFASVNEPPIEDAEFQWRIKRAQAAQALFLLGGTQVRDMARDGILMTRALTGSEMEFTGYRGAVCTEAKEILAPYIEIMPRRRRL